MTAPMQPDPLDAPDWLVTLLGEHEQTAAITPFGCFICRCNGIKVEQAAIWNNVANGLLHRPHVAGVVWRELYRRMSEVNPDDNMLDALGADDD